MKHPEDFHKPYLAWSRHSTPETIRRNLVTETQLHGDLYSRSPALTAVSVAGALHVSPRTLQKVFEAEEHTLNHIILVSRLTRARTLMERDRTSIYSIT
ncbi:hypothetical protein [Arthrobacter alpinus]|uniref:hypothetical protein n=1 Tax=Arthrobacter alpinus TaxID=656366 RepID=UPI000944791E|nr:hypothetical protein [Arthrobacter alpinus]